MTDRIMGTHASMSSAQRRFAELVLRHPLKVARLTINEAVAEAGVSVATANRFATALGFDGYPEFRAELIRGFEKYFAPVERLRQQLAEDLLPHQIMLRIMEESARDLTNTARALSPDTLDRAAHMVAGARRIFIAGVDKAAYLAALLATDLTMCGCDVRCAENGGGSVGAMRHLASFGPDDLMIAIAMPHYYKETLDLAEFAKEAGIPILALTDSLLSPLASIATDRICLSPPGRDLPPLPATILAAIQGLGAAVAHKLPKAAEIEERYASTAYPWMLPSKHEKS